MTFEHPFRLASFCFDPALEEMGNLAAKLLLVCGIGWIIHDLIDEGYVPFIPAQSSGTVGARVSN